MYHPTFLSQLTEESHDPSLAQDRDQTILNVQDIAHFVLVADSIVLRKKIISLLTAMP